MDVKGSQLMRCIFCYVNPFLITNAKTQTREGLILNSTANGNTALKNMFMQTIIWLQIFFKEEVNNLLKEPHERKPTKQIPHVNETVNSNFFVSKSSYKKDDV